MKIRFAALVLAASPFLSPVLAEVKLPAIIGDHMVLQRGVPVRVWGWGAPGESVTVQFRGQTTTGITQSNGKWEAWLKPMAPAAPAEMTIRGANSLTVSDILVGEVWVGSGQSNMQWTVANSNDAAKEIAVSANPQIRLFRVPLKTMPEPQDDVEARWEVCSPDSLPQFSAVLYFFGRHLNQKLNVPMGLIQSAYGGTPAQAWTTKDALNADPALFQVHADWNAALAQFPERNEAYKKAIVEWESKAAEAKASGSKPPNRPGPPMGPAHSHSPSGLYNAMISPIVPYAIKGVIWYQGESNASKTQAPIYRRLMDTMILDWRKQWGIGDFPFLYVQLANFEKAGSPSDWVLVQEAQQQTLEIKRTGMAVINDIGEAGDIHPKNKQDVGLRLALAARHIAYAEDLVYRGPVFRQATPEATETGDRGNKIRVWFDSVGGGLKTRGGGPVKGFEVAGPDKSWVPAEAVVDGSTVVVSAPTITNPVSVRYAWAAYPDCNLINAEGLPAGVFRSER